MTEESHFDDGVRELASALIADRGAALGASGLHATVELKRWPEDKVDSSELRIAFWRGTAFVDVVEDFIIQAGRPVASLDEFRQWLEDSIDAIVHENSGQ